MGLTDVVHRKEKSEMENKKDFYQTPYCLTEALVDGLKDIKLIGDYFCDVSAVLDPCAGEGAIGAVLKTYFRNVKEYDLYSEYQENKDFLGETGKYQMVVMNPPYSQKNQFIEHALKIAQFVVVVMPENVVNYTKMNEQFFDKDEYIGKIKTYPKFFMNENLDSIKFGGMSTYSWYIWTNDWDWKRKHSKYKFEVIKDIRRFL